MLKSEPMAFLNFSITNSYLPVCLYMCVCVLCMCTHVQMHVCLPRVSSLSPPCRYQKSSSSHQAWEQALYLLSHVTSLNTGP